MGFEGAQGADLAQCPLAGSYSYYLENENALYEMAAGSINIPWLMGLALGEGNGGTAALAANAVVFCEPEWGFEGGGIGKDIGPGQQMVIGGSTGGNVVAW
jgi:hypothetical protein